MAIRVICPGCMTSFEVSDRFAGQKGPCPKCGHIIEIPKENLVVHAPEDMRTTGKAPRNIAEMRPVLRSRFVFNTRQVVLGLLGVVLVLAAAIGLSYLQMGMAKLVAGGIGLFLVTFPLVSFSYMMLRDDEDLEIFLGNELYRRSFLVTLGFLATWLVLELFLKYMNPGMFCWIYVFPMAVLGAFVAMIVFDTSFNKGMVLYTFIAICVIALRGIAFTDSNSSGWIWDNQRPTVRSVKDDSKGVEAVSEATKTDTKSGKSSKKPLNRNAPDAKSGLRR